MCGCFLIYIPHEQFAPSYNTLLQVYFQSENKYLLPAQARLYKTRKSKMSHLYIVHMGLSRLSQTNILRQRRSNLKDP